MTAIAVYVGAGLGVVARLYFDYIAVTAPPRRRYDGGDGDGDGDA